MLTVKSKGTLSKLIEEDDVKRVDYQGNNCDVGMRGGWGKAYITKSNINLPASTWTTIAKLPEEITHNLDSKMGVFPIYSSDWMPTSKLIAARLNSDGTISVNPGSTPVTGGYIHFTWISHGFKFSGGGCLRLLKSLSKFFSKKAITA